MNALIKVAVVDDHPIVRAGIRAVLGVAAGLRVVGEGACGADALRLVAELRPDVLILDVNLPDLNGIEVIRRLRDRGDRTPIIILTMHNDSQTVLGVLEAGANGYVVKDDALDALPEAVRTVADGKTWISPTIARQVVDRALAGAARGTAGDVEPGGPGGDADALTPREREVLCLLAQGLDNEAIAGRLVLTKRTVQNHISTIYDKLGVTSRTEALLYAVQRGWVQVG